MKNNSLKHDGFTLIEVILSFAIITLLIAGMYGLTVGATKNSVSGEIKQKGSLYGQEVLEDFRASDVTKTLTASDLTLSNGIKLTGSSPYTVNDYDLGNGYTADIEVVKNSSNIGSGQTIQGTTSDYSYTVNFKKDDLDSASMCEAKKDSEGQDIYEWKDETLDDITNPTEIDVTVDTDTDSNSKTITVKIHGGQSSFTSEPFQMNSEEDKKKEIRLSINCSEYNLPQAQKDDDKGFEVHVYNHDIVPVNICLQKTNIIDGSVVAEVGKYKLYNNRSSSETVSNMGDLYDINITVKKNDGRKVIDVFKGEISQNLIINDET